MTTKQFKAQGMHCKSCEKIIERSVSKLPGVQSIKTDYASEIGKVTFDSKKTTLKTIFKAIEKKGYDCSVTDNTKESTNNTVSAIIMIVGAVLILYFGLKLVDVNFALPVITANMGLGLLFLVGLLTGFHCVTMCGGFVVSYTARAVQQGKPTHTAHLSYATGKLISYTVIGAAFGLLGSIIAFTPMMRGIAGILAGLFLIIFGLNMLNIFPWLRKVRITLPKSALRLLGKKHQENHNNPLIIGLLNGLMIACGPLQAIYIMAAGTGSPIEGAKLLFVFALGTLPVMLGFGFLTSFLSRKATHKILKASGAIVIILGLVMLNRGIALTGVGLDANSVLTSVSAQEDKITGNAAIEDGEYQTIKMSVTRYGYEPDRFILKKGVPVKWIIEGKEITGCNNNIQVPSLGLSFDIKQGEQTVEFTPEKEGTISWSCWMGMIPGTFVVTDDVEKAQDIPPPAPKPSAGSCGGSCGSSSCGAATGGGCGCGGA